ncbi:HAMP domain-containing sensor histidine kinase [Acidovorax sp. SUPP3334]|uniref:sensor histidine kinase n=1 Tax=Acidovorax sp. SUPP3334 TaxID=2920881 RepID=UPI0023DE273F|nr:HAMP domain-containing sensor histidine kinase [Acidovorax sp. SUPP3334]GKT26761.1 HAMP domain-containing histidine kinase [Acidovorax sp. SUPP3334]
MNRHYLSAIAAVLVALLLRYLLNPVLGNQGPYLVLTLPIVVAAMYGGLGPALLATALGTLIGTYLFIARGAGLHDVLQPENVARILLFVAIGVAIGLMGAQLRRSRKALAEKVQQLHASNRAKDNAMAVLSHEIRNPLSAIHSAHLVLHRAPDDEKRVVWANEIIGRQVAQLKRMADDLLDLSGLMRGNATANLPVDLRQVLQQALEQSAPLCVKKGHRLETELGTVAAVVIGDAQRLVQVFANLLTNAAKYTDPGGKIALTVGLRAADHVEVSIEDDGVGLLPGTVDDLFEPFVQAPGAASNAEGGLGLGLAIVRKIVQAHGGEVTAESPGPGQGSRFTVRLPLAPDGI